MPDANAPARPARPGGAPPGDTLERWRSAHPGQPVVGVLPMNFPREIAHAGKASRSSCRTTSSR